MVLKTDSSTTSVLVAELPRVDARLTHREFSAEGLHLGGEGTRLSPDTHAMIRCLRWLRPEAQRWLITTINPVANAGARNASTSFVVDDAAAPGKLREANLAGLNIYFPTGTPRPTWDVSRKNQPRKERDEIESCSILYFDGDFLDKDGNVIATEESRLDAINAAVTAGTIPAPGLIIGSGNGVQCFWRLREPLEPEQAEGRNRGLIDLLQGDEGVWDRGRLMRVGGGINWPSKKKMDKGCVPILGRIIAMDDNAWASGDQFQWVSEKSNAKTKPAVAAAALGGDTKDPESDSATPCPTLPITSLDDTRISFVRPDVRQIIEDGKGEKYPSRSEAAYRVACYLVRCEVPDDVIRSVFENFKIGDTLRDASRKFDAGIARLIERAHVAVDNRNLAEMNERFSAGSVKGKFRVIKWVPDGRYPQQRVTEFYSRGDFCNAVVNPKIEVPVFDKNGKPNGTEFVGRGRWWLNQDGREEYDGIDYRPGAPEEMEVYDPRNGNALRILNMFAGFSVEPDFEDCEKKCDRYLEHMRANIAGGNDELNTYILARIMH